MAHDVYDEKGLTHEELKYLEHTRRGADFIKIDLFRSARGEFMEAMTYKPGDDHCRQQIVFCNEQITRDARVVFVVVPIVLALIAAIVFLG